MASGVCVLEGGLWGPTCALVAAGRKVGSVQVRGVSRLSTTTEYNMRVCEKRNRFWEGTENACDFGVVDFAESCFPKALSPRTPSFKSNVGCPMASYGSLRSSS